MSHTNTLLVSNAVLIYHYEVSEGLCGLEESITDRWINKREDRSVLSQIMADSVINLRYLGDVELARICIIEILLDLGPATTNQHYIFAFAA